MDNQDRKIRRLYTELYSNTHASEEFRSRVRTMTERKKSKMSFKVIGVLVATAVLLVAGSMVVSASRGVYSTVILNGEEKKIRFGDFGNNVRVWGYEDGDTMYSIYVFGDFDMEKETLHIVDKGEYFLASTIDEPTLNLYTDIDKSSNAKIKEIDGQKVLSVTDDAGTQNIMLSFDEEDGVADGKITHNENCVETFAILPNGSVVNTMKEKITLVNKVVNRVSGGIFRGTNEYEEINWEKFWSSFDDGNLWDNFSAKD